MKTVKLLIVYFLSFIVSVNLYADDTTHVPIHIEETTTNPSPSHKPKAPSREQLQAYYNGVGITISSSMTLQAEVMIYDNLTGEQYFNGTVTLAPSFFCGLPAHATSVSIQIKTQDTE